VLARHCSLAHGGAWTALAAHLGAECTLTAPDLPSHGQSADVPPGVDLHDLSTTIAAELATRMGDGGPVDVLGHSFGGTVALRLALERPDLVRSLTLFEPVLFAAAKSDPALQLDAWMGSQSDFARFLATGETHRAAEWFNGFWGNGTAWQDIPAGQQAYMADRIHLIPATNAVLFDDRAGMLAPGWLEGLSCPVLLAEGGTSPAVVAAISTALAARLPAATRIVVAGAGHMLPITHAAALAPNVSAHLP